MKITWSQVRADDGGWSNTYHRKHFRSLFVAAAVCSRALSWRRTIPEDNIPRRLFWIKESNYSTHSTFVARLYFLGMFTCLRAQKSHVRCVAIDGNTRDIAQHICAKLHLILTVVLILQPIALWKKNSRRIIKFTALCFSIHNLYIEPFAAKISLLSNSVAMTTQVNKYG